LDVRTLVKIVLVVVVVLVFAGSFVADYKWRKWVRERRGDRQ
jgi:hypothetical protein